MSKCFELFKYDYKKLCGKDYKTISGIARIIKNSRIRYLFYSRMSYSGNIFIKLLFEHKIRKYMKKYGLEINTKNIGPGLLLIHPYSITINSDTIIKGDLTIFKGATIGSVRSGKRKGTPTFEKNIVMCVNSTVVGNVHIGNDVLIAPNAYVNFDVPDHSIVIGNPGVIHHKKNATQDYMSGV